MLGADPTPLGHRPGPFEQVGLPFAEEADDPETPGEGHVRVAQGRGRGPGQFESSLDAKVDFEGECVRDARPGVPAPAEYGLERAVEVPGCGTEPLDPQLRVQLRADFGQEVDGHRARDRQIVGTELDFRADPRGQEAAVQGPGGLRGVVLPCDPAAELRPQLDPADGEGLVRRRIGVQDRVLAEAALVLPAFCPRVPRPAVGDLHCKLDVDELPEAVPMAAEQGNAVRDRWRQVVLLVHPEGSQVQQPVGEGAAAVGPLPAFLELQQASRERRG